MFSYPLALPTTSSLLTQSCPGAYNPLSSTWLLSPLVSRYTWPSWLHVERRERREGGREGGSHYYTMAIITFSMFHFKSNFNWPHPQWDAVGQACLWGSFDCKLEFAIKTHSHCGEIILIWFECAHAITIVETQYSLWCSYYNWFNV